MGQLSNVFTDEQEALLLKNMRNHLIKLAKNHESKGYQKFSDEHHLDYDMTDIEDRNMIGKFLGKISEDEFAAGLPLLSVFIEHEDTHLPGKGFFTMAERLGRFMPKFMSKEDFVRRERTFACEYWKKH